MRDGRNWPASMSLRTAAEYLDCSPSQVEKLIREGHLRCHSLTRGGDRRLTRTALDNFLTQRELEGIIAPCAANSKVRNGKTERGESSSS